MKPFIKFKMMKKSNTTAYPVPGQQAHKWKLGLIIIGRRHEVQRLQRIRG